MPPPQLSRILPRRLLLSRPTTHHLRLQLYSLQTLQCRIGNRNGSLPVQARSFWGFSSQPRKRAEPRDPELFPGIHPMLNYASSQRLKTRPPPLDELGMAFREYFTKKLRLKENCEDHEVAYARMTYDHLKENAEELRGLEQSPLDQQFLCTTVLPCLQRKPRDAGEEHVKFARQLYADTAGLLGKGAPIRLSAYCTVLSRFGHAEEALEVLKQALEGPRTPELPARARPKLASDLLSSFIKGIPKPASPADVERVEKVRADLVHTFGEESLDLCSDVQALFYAQIGEIRKAIPWYIKAIKDESRYTPHDIHITVIQCWLKEKDISIAAEPIRVITGLLEDSQDRQLPRLSFLWNGVFLWSSAIGKGVEELEKTGRIARQRTNGAIPTSSTVNALLQLALRRNDPYTAERIISLGARWDIRPNASTYRQQLEYRLSAGDVDGARAAYTELAQLNAPDSADLPLLNRLIRDMIRTRRYTFDSLMDVVENVATRKVRFEPETVAALCSYHLELDELDDVVDLLATHASYFSPPQRRAIRDVFVTFTRNRLHRVGRVWDAYNVLVQAFPETDRSTRTLLMGEFFARGRSDMACHVFNHMREFSRPDTHPTADTYARCFIGLAAARDAENVGVVHNLLKLDLEVDPTASTALLDALMLAYTAVGRPRRALEFWDEVCRSREGPSYESIVLAFRACEIMPYGHEEAARIWRTLRQMDVEMDDQVVAAYIGALSANGNLSEAMRVVEVEGPEVGVVPGRFVLATLYNTTPTSTARVQVGDWIARKRPGVWQELCESLPDADQRRKAVLEGAGRVPVAAFPINRAVMKVQLDVRESIGPG